MTSETLPMALEGRQTAPAVIIAPTYKDPVTGALYVHHDLECVQDHWHEQLRIAPINVTERFGDVESWVAYVHRYAQMDPGDCSPPYLTWNRVGLQAVLDYHATDRTADRCQWRAVYPFTPSSQWSAWMALASGRAIDQRTVVERLEDLAEEIVEPSAADLAHLLRALRASVKATADTELRPDGSSLVQFSQDTKVKAGPGSVDLPAGFEIAIPVLKGHVDADGRPVLYRLQVRLRVTVDDTAHLAFRLSIPTAERVLEDVYADRVRQARELLGDGYLLLRAAD